MRRILPILICLALLLPAAVTAQARREYALLGRYPARQDGVAEPILWMLLKEENGKAFLLSDKVLDARAAHAGADYAGFASSDLRSWLLRDFAATAFDAPILSALAAGDAEVTLPTAALLKDASLGFTDNASRAAAPTAYALAQGVVSYSAKDAGYWLADTALSMAGAQRRIIRGGALGYARADAAGVGVRPLLILNLAAASGRTGTGAPEDPYIFSFGEQVEDAAPTEIPAPTPAPTPRPEGMVTLEGFPPLTAEGFLPAGEPEYVFIDEAAGLWRYASQDLRIVITRYEDKSVPLRWLGAEVFAREGTGGFRMVPNDPAHMLEDREKYLGKPAAIARANGLVFSMDGDYFVYRIRRAKEVGKGHAIGVVVRDGQVLVDSPPSPKRSTYPPLDMLALFPDGDMRVYKALEHTAAELTALGARDVLSFGPYLIRDGEVNTSYINYGTTLQPRAAIGMVAKGHYWAVIVEGRIRQSRGMTCREVADLFVTLGCPTAFNLDGGWTSAMVFMGKQLNQLDKSGVHDNARTQNEVMGIGHTDAFSTQAAP